MKIPKGYLFALIIFIVAFVLIGFSQEHKKESTLQEKTITEQQKQSEKDLKPQEEKKPEEKKSTPSKEVQQRFDYDVAEVLRESQRNVDRSINILSLVATFICGLVTLFTVGITVAGLTGFLSYKKWAAIKKAAEEDVNYIKELRNKAEEDVSKLRQEISKTPTSDFIEKPSQELIKKLDEHSRRLELIELLGLPLKAEDYINRGFNLVNKNNYEHALIAIEKAIELEPNNLRAWVGKGIVLDSLERHDEALIACEKTIELKPEEAFTWNNKGASLINLKRFEEALSPIEKALEIMPFYAVAWTNKGNALIALKRYDESLEAHMSALEIDSDIAEAWFNIACIFSVNNDRENMLTCLEKAMELNPKLKEEAKKDEDFKDYWEDAEFQKITS